MLIAENLEKRYRSGSGELHALREVNLRIGAGEFVSIIGPSGSGKTTLLGLLAGLDQPTGGRVLLDNTDLGRLDEDGLARLRRERVGFVFQSFNLIPTLTARENVQVPLELRGEPNPEARASDLLQRVGLAGRERHYPAQLSGGEQQRVAIARAFCTHPRVLFADEPTGNLDAAAGATVVGLLRELNQQEGTTLVLVTHDADLAATAGRTIRLGDGRVLADDRRSAAAPRGRAPGGGIPDRPLDPSADDRDDPASVLAATPAAPDRA